MKYFATHVTLIKGKGMHKYVLTKTVLYTKSTLKCYHYNACAMNKSVIFHTIYMIYLCHDVDCTHNDLINVSVHHQLHMIHKYILKTCPHFLPKVNIINIQLFTQIS